MSISYNYEVISVDKTARVMEVRYTAENRQAIHISARLPYVGETIEALVKMYSPVAYWLEQEREVLVPDVGFAGVIEPEPEPEADPGQIPVTEF